jgi:hypothetical protein
MQRIWTAAVENDAKKRRRGSYRWRENIDQRKLSRSAAAFRLVLRISWHGMKGTAN